MYITRHQKIDIAVSAIKQLSASYENRQTVGDRRDTVPAYMVEFELIFLTINYIVLYIYCKLLFGI